MEIPSTWLEEAGGCSRLLRVTQGHLLTSESLAVLVTCKADCLTGGRIALLSTPALGRGGGARPRLRLRVSLGGAGEGGHLAVPPVDQLQGLDVV